MSLKRNKYLRLALLVIAGQLVSVQALFAQAPGGPVSAEAVSSNGTVTVPGLPPCPVELFRQLLDKNCEAQEQLLTNRPPEIREQIAAKVREYQALPKEQRELKLRATELRWHLRRLMSAPAANRPALLAAVPAPERKWAAMRLLQWDKLPAAAQAELQTNEAAIVYFTTPDEQKSNYWVNSAPALGNLTSDGIDKWRSLSGAERQKNLAGFKQYFDLPPAERDKILNSYSEVERQQIEKTLKKYEEFTPAQRALCIHSFQKFSKLSPGEQEQFLQNAERWKLMTQAERQQWQELVDLAVIMPPEEDAPPTPPGSPP
jgi:hypothetical protein